MPTIQYLERRFSVDSLNIIDKANQICVDYRQQGFDLTLRQLYYQFVARGWIPNKDSEYKRLGSIINDARIAGKLDWNYIVDRTRFLRSQAHWNTPADIIRSAAYSYRLDRWKNQNYYVEVWIEKDALVGVIEGVCRLWDVPFFSCRGYTSQSEVWGAAQRLLKKQSSGKHLVIIHLGDHDPSGIDMTRDILDRLALFMYDDPPYIRRIALNYDQVQQYNPPPNPTKLTDSRARSYIDRFGNESWELDALDPATITRLIENAVMNYLDQDMWDLVAEKEKREKETLNRVDEHWLDVASYINTLGDSNGPSENGG